VIDAFGSHRWPVSKAGHSLTSKIWLVPVQRNEAEFVAKLGVPSNMVLYTLLTYAYFNTGQQLIPGRVLMFKHNHSLRNDASKSMESAKAFPTKMPTIGPSIGIDNEVKFTN
jgi:hypothetical protein